MGTETVNRPVNVANTGAGLKIRIQNNKINSRQCLRYTKVALVDIATRLKIALPSKLTKPILCDLIKKSASANKSPPKSRRVTLNSSPPKRRRVALNNVNSSSTSPAPRSSPKKKKFKNSEELYNYIEQFGGRRGNSPPMRGRVRR